MYNTWVNLNLKLVCAVSFALAALLSGEKDLLILLGLALLRIRSILLLNSFVELGGYENHSVELASCLRHHASQNCFPLHADAYPWQS